MKLKTEMVCVDVDMGICSHPGWVLCVMELGPMLTEEPLSSTLTWSSLRPLRMAPAGAAQIPCALSLALPFTPGLDLTLSG